MIYNNYIITAVLVEHLIKGTEYEMDSLLITVSPRIKIITRALTFIPFHPKKRME